MIIKKQFNKSKKKIFTSFYKYYFFISIVSFGLIILIFFNSESWNYYKLKLLSRLEAYGILNYSKLPEVLLLKIKGHFTKVDKIFINIRFKEELKIDKQLCTSYKNRFIAEKNFNLPSYKIVYESLKRYAKNK